MAGLYFHIPFCKSKCPYCDFYSVKYDEALAKQYVAELINEMKQYQGSFDTVYFGGGTPSILKAELLGEILTSAREQFDISPNAEITVECNPSKDLVEDFKRYREFGINRVSIGMQSAVDKERFALGRSAGRVQVAKSVNDAKKAGIMNVSLDVMLGTPKQTMSSLDETFDFIEQMDVQHISAYMLKLEEGTKFYDMQDRLLLPDEDIVGDMYLKTVDSLAKIGFEQYEISNFAKSGFESRHNTKYWILEDYLGVGKSAHSLWNGRRFYYDKSWNKVDDGAGGTDEERVMLGLRLTKGVDKKLLSGDYTQYVDMGLMKDLGDRAALTPQGMLVSNTIINSLL